MALKISNDSNNGTETYGIGVFINKVTVASAEDRSGQKPVFLQSAPDVWIELTLDIGRGFRPRMSFFGDFKRDDQTREITDWGSAFKVKNLFANLGIEGDINEDGTIPSSMLEKLPGKEFYRLKYASKIRNDGKVQYSDWTDRVDVDNPKRLAQAFFKSVDRGYPRNYRPELVDGNFGVINELAGPWDEEIVSTIDVTEEL
jgi:hypothetical protein